MKKICLLILAASTLVASLCAQGGIFPGGSPDFGGLGAKDAALSKIVSLDGKFAPVDLINWMRKQDFSFVLKPGVAFGKDPIEIRIKEKPLRHVLSAIAFSLDSNWVVVGEVYVLVGPQVFVSNGVVVTSSGRVVSEPTPSSQSFQSARMTPQQAPQRQLVLFVHSLTTAQQKLLKKKGFLTLSNLSKHQLSLLANPKADGSTIETIIDGQRVAVKLTRQSG